MSKPGRAGLLLAALLVACGGAQALEVGDPAPPLRVKKWLAGEPLSIAEAKGRFVLVEWFATWCGDSRKAVPRLNRLQRLYAKHLDIVAVTDEDEAVVRKHLEFVPVGYRVALDEGTASKKVWMQYVVDTPHAFLVGRDGKVAWHGDPAIGLYPALADLLGGTYDPARYTKLNKIYFEFTHALKAHKIDEMLRLLDQMIATVPEDAWAYHIKLPILRKQRKTHEARELYIAMGKRCTSDPDALAEAARKMATVTSLTLRDVPLALGFAQRAAELTRNEEPPVLDVLARVHYELGHLAKAIDAETLAAGLASGNDKAVLERTLRFYRDEQARRAADPDAK